MDVLASIAYAWCLRKGTTPSAAVVGADGDDPDDTAKVAADDMERAVRAIFEQVLKDAESEAVATEAADKHAAAFPALGGTNAPADDGAGGLQFQLDEDQQSVDDSPLPDGTPLGGGSALGTPPPVSDAATDGDDVLGTSPNQGVSFSSMDGDAFFMYQAADATPLFVHPINVRSTPTPAPHAHHRCSAKLFAS